MFRTRDINGLKMRTLSAEELALNLIEHLSMLLLGINDSHI